MGCYPFSLSYGRVEVREESRLRGPTKFRSIADVLMKTRVEE